MNGSREIRPGDGIPARHRPGPPGFSLVEIMTATVIVALLVLILAQILTMTARTWARAQRASDIFHEGRVAMDFLRRDLAAAVGSRPAPMPRLPEESSDPQRAVFEGRILVPFAVDRQRGDELSGQSFLNGEDPETGFGSLAFVQTSPLGGQFYGSFTGSAPGQSRVAPGLGWGSGVTLADLSLCGYYVAYTRNSALAGSASSMKLFRHLRPSGNPGIAGPSVSRGYLQHVINEINRRDERWAGDPDDLPTLLAGDFANHHQPFLMTRSILSADDFRGMPTMQPWPINAPLRAGGQRPDLPVPPDPFPPPDRSDPDLLVNPNHPAHGYLYPDEPLVRNVVRFELKPYRWVDIEPENPEGEVERRLMGTRELNVHLELPVDQEWPVLVTPDFIDVTLGVISDETAAKLPERSDWIIDWSPTNSVVPGWQEDLVRQEMKLFRSRIHVRGNDG